MIIMSLQSIRSIGATYKLTTFELVIKMSSGHAKLVHTVSQFDLPVPLI